MPRLLLSLLCLVLPAAALADGTKTMRLASLEWLPYAGSRLEREGWSSSVAQAAARQAGWSTQIDYFPWTRAMQLGLKDRRYAGYFPAYYTEERARECHFSQPIGSSTIGLAYLAGAPLRWNAVSDLSSRRIGVVAGFSNGAAFDALAREGKLQLDASPNDMLNLRKLLAGRVDGVVIDKLVLRYLLLTEPSVSGRDVVFHDRVLAELPLHVCFQRTAAGRAMQQAFDGALLTMPLRRMESAYFQRLAGLPAPK
ncbi:MAG TPA: transporter substrate-binding domain-containing protein [Noviherbaspirillum sp.]|jgi:polar amino acid transport system substrate-binding protein|uniref:substrate-binding periplasmic protein n=1 Tax=Noviherbaspirillum sp. TaxID=1926288 RepID=UPI002F9532A9